MKKLLALILVIALCLSLSACGKSEAVTNFEKLMGQIGTVSLDSEAAILAAEEAYNQLSEKEQKQVDKDYQKLNEYRTTYETLVEEAELQAKLDEVVALIDAVGEVTADSEAAILAAEAAYNALSADEQAKIKESGDKLAAMRETYNTAILETSAAAVVEAIDAIGEVTLDSAEAINAAKELYNALTPDAQALVTNAAALTDAEAALADLVAAEKERILQEYLSNFTIDEDKVEKLAWYMHDDMPDYIDIRSYIIPYIGVQNNNVWICIRYNYTADDWVFWEKLTIVTDNNKYYRILDYFDTVRDNDGGVVWEYYDEPLYYNQALDTEELLMLQDIADSEEVIIRFEGDEYYDDLYVTDTDKAIIRDVLALYSALLP
ncbi:MAG: hypothetical protein IKU17_07770 [Clostridia bacterium]|nr:hypothetical protein [Clostridia bacterium]